jgi:hypothetical protein
MAAPGSALDPIATHSYVLAMKTESSPLVPPRAVANKRSLGSEIVRDRGESWRQKNAEVIAASNDYVERYDVSLNRFRRF